MTAEQQITAYEELLEWLKVELDNRHIQIHEEKQFNRDWFYQATHMAAISCDYYVARGWFDKMLHHLKESEFEQAEAAGRNMLDAILRTLIRIGIDKAVFDAFLNARGFQL